MIHHHNFHGTRMACCCCGYSCVLRGGSFCQRPSRIADTRKVYLALDILHHWKTLEEAEGLMNVRSLPLLGEQAVVDSPQWASAVPGLERYEKEQTYKVKVLDLGVDCSWGHQPSGQVEIAHPQTADLASCDRHVPVGTR